MSRRTVVIASRTMLTMLLIAGLVVIGLGAATQILGDPPEVEGWLRTVFGKVFAVVAFGLGTVLVVPSGVGLWAMAGAAAEDAEPALPRPVRLVLAGIAVAAVVATVVICLTTGSSVFVLNLGLIALVALSALGLAGAAYLSPHAGRAAVSGVALVFVVAGAAWVLVNAFIAPPGAA
jgi:hypothetical protein